jgi:hypothetical protein
MTCTLECDSPSLPPTDHERQECGCVDCLRRAVPIDFISHDDRKRLERVFSAGASRVTLKDEHWIHGHDEGTSFCHACATSKVAELLRAEPDEEYQVDGGWGIEGDHLASCEHCHARLSNSLTNYGCESELEHFLGYGFDPKNADDCYSLERCISSRGWEPWEFSNMRAYELRNEREYFRDLHRLCRAILAVLDNPQPRREAKAARARHNAMRAYYSGRGHRQSYWWKVYHRWANPTQPIT